MKIGDASPLRFTRPDKAKAEAYWRDMSQRKWLAHVAALVAAIGFVASGIFTAKTTTGAMALGIGTTAMTLSAVSLFRMRRRVRSGSSPDWSAVDRP
jgi:lysozyme family protein